MERGIAERGLPWDKTALAVSSAAAIGCMAAALAVAGPMILDDGYYYLQIARHVSHGHGPTFDGMNPTNGFHPLWLLMLLPVFWSGAGSIAAAFLATALQTLCFVGSGWLMYAVLRRLAGRTPAAVAACCWLLNAWLWSKAAVSGMETGLAVLCLGAVCLLFVRQLESGASRRGLGVALCCLAAARLDTLPLAAAILLAVGLRQGLRRAVSAALPTLVYLPLYAVANVFMVGHPLPVSGYIKTTTGRELAARLFSSGDPLFFVRGWHNLASLLTLNGRLPLAVPLAIGAAALAWMLAAPRGNRKTVAAICALYAGSLLAFYALMYPSLLALYTYYYVPLLYAAFIFAFALLGGVPHRLRGVQAAGGAAAVLATLVLNIFYVPNRLELQDFAGSAGRDPASTAIDYVSKELPADAIVGCWDAGRIGYYAARRVVNLDGFVNSYEFLDAVTRDGLAAYLDRENISFLAGNDAHTRKFIEEQLGWKLYWETCERQAASVTRLSISPENPGAAAAGVRRYYLYARPRS